jgi:hypothetical protein
MHLGRIALKGSALALCAAGAMTVTAGTALASTPTSAPQPATLSSTVANYPSYIRDFCDDYGHRGDRRCHQDRWNWDPRFHRFDHDRFDGHRWNRR